MDPIFKSLYCVVLVIAALLGFSGNLVVIIVYVSDKTLRSYKNYFFVNLSLTDILIATNSLPIVINDLVNDGVWRLGRYFCPIGFYIENILVTVSSLTLISIGIERFLAISHPFHVSKLLDRKASILIIIFLWVISIIVCAPFIHFATYIQSEQQNQSTPEFVCFLNRDLTNEKIFVTSYTSIIIFAPSFILTLAYLIIIRKLKKINCNFFSSSEDNGSKTKRKKNSDAMMSTLEAYTVRIWTKNNSKFESRTLKFSKRSKNELNRAYSSDACLSRSSPTDSIRFSIKSSKDLVPSKMEKFKSCHSFYSNNLIAKRKQTITICLISLAFFFCQIPIKVFQLFNTYYVYNTNHEVLFPYLNTVFIVTKLLFFLHGISNPIIYNLMSSKFSNSFRNVILCKNKKKPEKNFN